MSVKVLQRWIVVSVFVVSCVYCDAGADDAADLTVRAISAGDTTYYVDAEGGDNDNPGNAPEKAWKTLEPVNAMTLAPGDKVLLKADCVFTGWLHPKGCGAEGMPIAIDRYGHGADPIVAGEGKVENTIRLHNQSFWELRNLTVTNTDGGGWDDEGRTIRRAVYITAEDAGDVKHIRLNSLEIRDVRGMYRFEGKTTNGGIICQVLGDKKSTRFVDLRIEDCVLRTRSIDRYPVVVTSSWKKDPACQVVWKNNTLDHAGQAHIVIPADQWPRTLVYYFDPEVRKVFPLEKTAVPVSPFTGRVGCEDIFSEMAARLRRSWSFFEATRCEKDRWLFKHSPTDKGNMRYLSHSYDWQLRNRVFMADRYTLPPGGLHGRDPMPTREAAIKCFNAKPWATNAYAACNFMGKEMKSHCEILRATGKDQNDEIIQMLHEMIDAQFVDGHWGAKGSPDGNMKMLVTYCSHDWPIPDHKKLIDYTLSFATDKAGFAGRGCTSFNQTWSLAEARRQFPDGYRGDEIDKYTAMTFTTFLNNWDEKTNFYSNNWNGKHNNGVPLFMSHLMLDLPVMRGSAVYNWRQNPIIDRDKNGKIKRNKVIYQTPGFLFYD